ncbi:MAG: cation:proton antiporter [Planctomycetota bacterium]
MDPLALAATSGNLQLTASLALLIVLGVGAQWLAWRLRFPSILGLLLVGLAAGPGAELLVGARLLDPDLLLGGLLLPLTSLAVAVVLYEGGLSLRLREIGAARVAVRNLVGAGALVTWLGATAAAWGLGLLGGGAALLLGAILVVTGPTVIVPLLRDLKLRGRVGPVLKWEGIASDPLGATLAVLVFEALVQASPRAGLVHAALGFLRAAGAGFALGGLGAAALILFVRRRWVPDHLEGSVSLAIALVAFTLANGIQAESGLLAATVMGCVVGNVLREEARPIRAFKENLQVLLIGGLFVILAARLAPADLASVLSLRALAFVALLVLVVRPLAVLVATLGTPLTWEERVFVACVAPRGIVAAAVASVFALQLAEGGGLEGGALLAPLVFLVILVTVAVYGLGAAPLARWLGLAEASPGGLLLLGAHPWARALARALSDAGALVRLIDGNPRNVRAALDQGLDATEVDALDTHALERIDLQGIGRFLATTPNDAVNALAAARFRRLLERSHVFLVQPHTTGEGEHAPSARLRAVFAPGVDHDWVAARFAAGARFAAEPAGPAGGLGRWRARYGQDAAPLAVVDERGAVRLRAVDEDLDPRPGEWVIGLVPAGTRRPTPEPELEVSAG